MPSSWSQQRKSDRHFHDYRHLSRNRVPESRSASQLFSTTDSKFPGHTCGAATTRHIMTSVHRASFVAWHKWGGSQVGAAPLGGRSVLTIAQDLAVLRLKWELLTIQATLLGPVATVVHPPPTLQICTCLFGDLLAWIDIFPDAASFRSGAVLINCLCFGCIPRSWKWIRKVP